VDKFLDRHAEWLMGRRSLFGERKAASPFSGEALDFFESSGLE
jgi:hypothetical protein